MSGIKELSIKEWQQANWVRANFHAAHVYVPQYADPLSIWSGFFQFSSLKYQVWWTVFFSQIFSSSNWFIFSSFKARIFCWTLLDYLLPFYNLQRYILPVPGRMDSLQPLLWIKKGKKNLENPSLFTLIWHF